MILSLKEKSQTKEEPKFWESMHEKASGVLIYNFGILITLSHLFYLLFFTFVNFINNPLDKFIGLLGTFFGILILFITILFFFVLRNLIKICLK